MSKQTKRPGDTGPVLRNCVARHAGKFNKAQVHRDKTKYFRKEKHKKGSQDPFCLDKYLYELSYNI